MSNPQDPIPPSFMPPVGAQPAQPAQPGTPWAPAAPQPLPYGAPPQPLYSQQPLMPGQMPMPQPMPQPMPMQPGMPGMPQIPMVSPTPMMPPQQVYGQGNPYLMGNYDHGAAQRSAGVKMMIYGAILAVVGTVITVGTLSAASNGGGTYFIAWGPMLFGVIRFFQGLIKVSTAPRSY